ncbi:MAG TPA: enoyl-CoA hydratase-related protein [Candidatus Acidoferrales bacterium]|nr:enoyl-CoA hydratase-related protein [Candidatus Acidoferrales bacterium]
MDQSIVCRFTVMLPRVTPSAGDADSQLVISSRPAPGVRHIALNQPERRNALTAQVAWALREELEAIAADPTARSLIVTGNGPAFCAGADLGSLGAEASTPAAKRQVLSDYYRAFLDLRDLAIPTIAAVNGPAIGAGLNLALCCDLRIVSDDARLAAPFVKLGIHPGGGATWMLTRLTGPAAARELLLLGQPIGAERAFQLGLANRVIPAAQLQEAALEWAVSLAALPAPVLRNLKRTLASAEAGESLAAVLRFETQAQAEALASEDAREGWTALREHRQPEFHDR